MYPSPPLRVWAPQVSICAFAAGVFTGGGGLKNQLKKVAIGVDTTCLASENSGSETNAQGAVAILQPRVQKWPHSFEQQPEFLKWILC